MGGGPVDLAFSTNSDMRDYMLAGAQPSSADCMYHHDLAGRLQPGTQYYAKPVVAGSMVMEQTLRFRTLPSDSDPTHLRIALLSCQRQYWEADPTQLGWANILRYDPDLVLHLGDFGYWGAHLSPTDPYVKHIACYRDQLVGLPVMRSVFQDLSSLIQVSDHETSRNDGNTFNNPKTATALRAYFRMMPWRTFDDPTGRSRFLTRKLGENIRLISPDFRSLDRSLEGEPDTPAKTAYGQNQFDLLVEALRQPEPLKILISDPGCAPAAAPRRPKESHLSDKWCNYQSAYQAMVDVIENETTVTGGPITVDVWSGDRHMLGITKAVDNSWGNFDVLTSSSIDQDALELETGETYTAVYGNRVAPGRHPNKVHMEIDLDDDKAGLITRTVRGIDNVTNEVVLEDVQTWSY